VYNFIGEPTFARDFENVEFDAAEFDRRLGTPGLHAINRQVRHERRRRRSRRYRGWLTASKVSMRNMRPPQQGKVGPRVYGPHDRFQ